MSEIVSQVNDKLQENKIANINKYFTYALLAFKGLDSDERLMLLHFYHFLDFNKAYYEQTYFHSIPQWSERLEIGQMTVKRKIKSLKEKGIWIIISGSAKKEANIFQLTSLLTDRYLAERDQKKKLVLVQTDQNGPTKSIRQTKMVCETDQNGPTQTDQNGLPSHVLINSYLNNHVCVEKEHTHTLVDEKTKTRRDTKLAGIFGDFVKKYTKEGFIAFDLTQKNINGILKKYPSVTSEIFIDEFYTFQNLADLHKYLNLSNVTLENTQRAFEKHLSQKFSPIEDKKIITDISALAGPISLSASSLEEKARYEAMAKVKSLTELRSRRGTKGWE